ncbi:MAG: pyridoxal phosphate-dependent aminotransferase [Bacteroidetes bacterium]|nr:MAG: pyridoxal phosphate-dependent aminotransferase [Bacteroidota bacterium]
MTKEKIYLSSPHLGGNEIKYVQEAFDTNWIAPLGPNVNGFEEELAAYSKTAHCAALSSGTAALHLALILLGIEQDDEVLCSTFTFSATVNAIAYQKAIPIFVDSEKETWNICPKTLEEAICARIENGTKPKALVLVHLYGMPSKMEEIMQVCDKYSIPIIEDSAEALGATYKGQKMGTFGKLGVFSFNGNKIITTSGGGALISEDQGLIDKSRFLATQARDAAPHYQHSQIGYNYRMSNIVAGIGRGQLEVLDNHIALRRANNEWYKSIFQKFEYIEVFTEPSSDYFSNHWLTCILVHSNKKNIVGETIRLALEDENIECRPLWKPMHQQPVFSHHPFYSNGTSDGLFEIGLCMPSGSNLSDNQRYRIKSALLKVLRN